MARLSQRRSPPRQLRTSRITRSSNVGPLLAFCCCNLPLLAESREGIVCLSCLVRRAAARRRSRRLATSQASCKVCACDSTARRNSSSSSVSMCPSAAASVEASRSPRSGEEGCSVSSDPELHPVTSTPSAQAVAGLFPLSGCGLLKLSAVVAVDG